MSDFGNKKSYPSAERNKPFILNVLKKHFDCNKEGDVLEVSSGTGQHVAYFAQHFPLLTFHPTEYERSLFKSIEAYANETPTKNVRPPVFLDITTDATVWNLAVNNFDYMININMMHIAPFKCTEMLFKNASQLLKYEGLMITYGPYAVDGSLTPQSNVVFDRNLRAENPEWGVRDISDLTRFASENNMKLVETYDLPSNNKCLVWGNYNDNK